MILMWRWKNLVSENKIYVEKMQQRHEIKVAFMRTIGASLELQ